MWVGHIDVFLCDLLDFAQISPSLIFNILLLLSEISEFYHHI